MLLEWKFLTNEGQEEEGLGHAGIETFKGSPYPGLARESAQNSLDACMKAADGSHLPVRMIFRQKSVPRESVPGIESLQRTLEACLTRSADRRIKKDTGFFENACAIIRKPSISILAVEDYGTTGLVGPSVAGTAFHALVKGSGVSQKDSSDAGGSFGIGKNAAFAVSALRTAFYSTRYRADGQEPFLAQGKAILVSHKDAADNDLRATGYWGAPRFAAVADNALLPDWLRRTETGTTVASLGFQQEDNWEWQMVESLIRNFFSAIRSGSITFSVLREQSDRIDVTGDSIDALFENPMILRAAEETGTSPDLAFSAAMTKTLNHSETRVFEEEFNGIGRFTFRLLEGVGLPRKVGFLRNGMYLTDNLRSFGHPLARFDLSRDFVGVVEPADGATSGRLRELENPRHDELAAERLDDLRRRKEVRAGMRKLGQWIRDIIKEHTATAPETEIQLDEMNRFFATPDKGSEIPDPANVESNPERIRLTPKNNRPRPSGNGPDGESGSAGGRKDAGKGTGRTTGNRRGRGRGATGGRGGRSVPFHSLRTHLPDRSDSRLRVIGLDPEDSGFARLEVLAVGAATDEPLDILRINGHRCAKTPSIELSAGTRKSVTVELAEPYSGPVRIILSRVEDSRDAG